MVEVVADRATPIGQSARRVRTHRTAAEGIAAHALIRNSLEVGSGDFSRTAGKPTGAEIPRRTAVECATTVEPTASVECPAALDSSAINDAIATEVTSPAEIAVATEVTAAAKIPATEITATEVAAAATEVTSAAAEPSTTHRAAAATAEASATMAATAAAVRRRDRGRHHLADDRSRYDHCSKPTSGLHRPMHRMFSGTGYGHERFINEPTAEFI